MIGFSVVKYYFCTDINHCLPNRFRLAPTMCTRFSYAIAREKLKRQFNLTIKEDELQYSYNIGAGQNAYVQTNESIDLQIFRFGFIPQWAKDEHVGLNLPNATAEHVASQHSFRMAVRQHRCLIFADSFYEWKRQGRASQPFRILLENNDIMALAGVWDVWTAPNGKALKSFAILTTTANAEMRAFGVRMPVILRDAAEQQKWLHDTTLHNALSSLRPLPDGSLRFFPVSKELDSLECNYPELHNPIELSSDEQAFWDL